MTSTIKRQSTLYTGADLNLAVSKSATVTTTAQANNNDMAILQVSGNKLYVNGMQANINYYGMIVFPIV